MPRRLVVGAWNATEVSLAWTRSTRPIIPEIEQLIETTWSAAMSRPGVHLFDGPMCRLEQLDSRRDGSLHLMLSKTSYKPFVGTNMNNAALLAERYGAAALVNPVGLSAVLISADGHLVLGRRNARVAYYPSHVHPFAGALEPREDLDVFDDVRRELAEELSFASADISQIICTGFTQDPSLLQPEMTFAVRTPRTLSQIRSQLDAEEHLDVWTTPAAPDAFDAALRSPEPFTPVAIGAILLWARLEFGEAWFESRGAT